MPRHPAIEAMTMMALAKSAPIPPRDWRKFLSFPTMKL
jgi:hypothetical protein